MTIFLAEPDANPVRTYSNGVKVVRLHEYLGPARGTLTTVSDPWSVCGTAVVDTQEIAYSGSDPNKTINVPSSAADTIRIPVADLDLDFNFHYRAFIGVRCEGGIDLTKQNATHNFLEIGANAAAVSVGSRPSSLSSYSSFGAVPFAPKPLTNPYYRLLRAASFSLPFFGAETDYHVIRAASGDGGDLSWFLDAYYLIPDAAQDFDNPSNPYDDQDFRFLVPGQLTDPLRDIAAAAYVPTRDDEDVDWLGPGQYSVMILAPNGYGASSSGPIADFQETELERTIHNAPDAPFPSNFSDVSSPISDVAIVAGSHFTPAHAIDADIFDRTITPALSVYLGESQENRVWTINQNHPMQAAGAGAGIGTDGTQMLLYHGKYDQAFPTAFPGTPYSGQADSASVILGASATETGTGSSSIGHETLTGMAHCVLEAMVATDHILVAGFQMLVGFADSSGSEFCGVVLDIPVGAFGAPSSELRGGLAAIETPFSSTRLQAHYLGGLDTLTSSFAADTFVRVKVEMRWYYFRAKAWIDGDTEPDWLWEGQIPADVLSTLYAYPWTTHGTNGANRRSRPLLYPFVSSRYFAPIEDLSGNVFGSGDTVRLTTTYLQDLSLDFDSHGDTPSDISLRLEKYDGGVDFGTVVIPFEAQRLVIAPWDHYSFNDGDDGWAATVWKDSGAPETQAGIIAATIEKIRRGRRRPIVYRRPVSG